MAPEPLCHHVGDRVQCNLGTGGWTAGIVIAVEDQQAALYRVELDCGDVLLAPADALHADDGEPKGTPSLPAGARLDADDHIIGLDVEAATAALQALWDEMDDLRALPSVEAAAGPLAMATAELGSRLFTPSDASGPWLVVLRLRGPAGDPAYGSTHRVHLKANALWPQSPAEVRFTGVLAHPLIGDGGLVDPETLAAFEEAVDLEGEGGPPHSLCRIVRALEMLIGRAQDLLPDDVQRVLRAMRAQNARRLDVINTYSAARRHPRLYDAEQGWAREWFDPAFLAALDSGTEESWQALVREEASQVYSFPLFTGDFCDMYVEELFSFYASGLPARRPNSMNNYGIIVNEIGLEPMNDRLQEDFLQPISRALFPGIGSHFGHQHSFVVRYKVGEDLGLDMHTDDSDVTFNVCMGRDFKGAGLQFCGNQGTAEHRRASAVYFHQKGRCVVHLGHRRHGADDITEGERLNLIFWNSNAEYRRTEAYARFRTQSVKTYDREAEPPDKVCVSFTHDRDYGLFMEYTEKSLPHRGRGWCPPKHAEYAGFLPEPPE